MTFLVIIRSSVLLHVITSGYTKLNIIGAVEWLNDGQTAVYKDCREINLYIRLSQKY